ncbi:MAG: hypothetical protein EAX86_09650 [Candidatus Heimdallarchaeota archaeon]|nr:hypothetical protein [Candidatus Heimdallarchaeota archaeon]
MTSNLPIEDKETALMVQPKKPSYLNILLSVLIAPITSYFLIVLITSGIEFISLELWQLKVVWPSVIFLGAVIGGFGGGMLVVIEAVLNMKKLRPITPPDLLSSDLAYISIIIGITYILEMIVEMIFLQVLLFLLEIALFFVFSRNLAKFTLIPPRKEAKKDISSLNLNSEDLGSYSEEV